MNTKMSVLGHFSKKTIGLNSQTKQVEQQFTRLDRTKFRYETDIKSDLKIEILKKNKKIKLFLLTGKFVSPEIIRKGPHYEVAERTQWFGLSFV